MGAEAVMPALQGQSPRPLRPDTAGVAKAPLPSVDRPCIPFPESRADHFNTPATWTLLREVDDPAGGSRLGGAANGRIGKSGRTGLDRFQSRGLKPASQPAVSIAGRDGNERWPAMAGIDFLFQPVVLCVTVGLGDFL